MRSTLPNLGAATKTIKQIVLKWFLPNTLSYIHHISYKNHPQDYWPQMIPLKSHHHPFHPQNNLFRRSYKLFTPFRPKAFHPASLELQSPLFTHPPSCHIPTVLQTYCQLCSLITNITWWKPTATILSQNINIEPRLERSTNNTTRQSIAPTKQTHACPG